MSSASNRNPRTTSTKTSGHTEEPLLDIHPTSQWEETARDDSLTLWEVHRRPRALINKDQRITCSLKLLNPHFQCVICLGYLKETTTVMVCLHRFCSECINRCIRIGMKECPNCRKPIPSRRSLRRDKKFDLIINRMMGTPTDRQHTEDLRGLEDAKNMVHLQKAIVKKKRLDRQKLEASSTTSLNSSEKPPPIINFHESPLVHIELRRHPQESLVDRLERPYLTLRSDAKVSLLKKFLNEKLEKHDYELSSRLDDDSVVLDDDLTLADTKDTLLPEGDSDSVLVLRYRLLMDDDTGATMEAVKRR